MRAISIVSCPTTLHTSVKRLAPSPLCVSSSVYLKTAAWSPSATSSSDRMNPILSVSLNYCAPVPLITLLALHWYGNIFLVVRMPKHDSSPWYPKLTLTSTGSMCFVSYRERQIFKISFPVFSFSSGGHLCSITVPSFTQGLSSVRDLPRKKHRCV